MKSPLLILLATVLNLMQDSLQGELKQLTNNVKDTVSKTVTGSFDKQEKRYVRQVSRPQAEEQILVPEDSSIGHLGLLPEPNELEYIKYNHETRRSRPKYRPKSGHRPRQPHRKPPRKPQPGKPQPEKPRPGKSQPGKQRPPDIEIEVSFEVGIESEQEPVPLKLKKDSNNIKIPMMVFIASRK